ncbi:hypothetical protein [Hydrogenimonas sp.]
MVRLFLYLVLIIFAAGCTADNGSGGFETKEPSAQKRTQHRTFVSDEELKTQKALAQIEAKKSVEIEKISSEARLRELELQKQKELELMREKERLLKIEHEQAIERYTLVAAVLLTLLAGAALLWYFDKRRKDKLRAYEDNLKKYFHQKENEARVKIAEKILDTVASKNLDSRQRAQLIEALHGSAPGAPKSGGAAAEPEEKSEEDAILIETKEDKESGTKA